MAMAGDSGNGAERPGNIAAVIGLGANIGDPQAQLQMALEALGRLPHTRLLSASSFYRTAPVGKTDQPDFVNAVALVATGLGARELLAALLAIEERQGRLRLEVNGPRTLDLDLLLYGTERIGEPGLSVPHPRMHERRFVLEPLLEILPDCVIPDRGPARALLARVTGQAVAPAQQPGKDRTP